MKFNLITVFAAALLLTACSSSEDVATDTSGTSSTDGSGTSMVAPGSVEDFQVNVGDRVFFDFDMYEIRPDAQDTLQKQTAWLQQYPAFTIIVEGHADERGTREYNLALGERRANAVKNYLIALGVDGNRMQTVSYGKERPEDPASNETAWALNRRGVTVLQ